jgi:hypothetical protein
MPDTQTGSNLPAGQTALASQPERIVHYPDVGATVSFPGDLSHEDFQDAARQVWRQFSEFGSGGLFLLLQK